MYIYQIVTKSGACMMNLEQLKEKYNVIGTTGDREAERANKVCFPRRELDNQPIIEGFLSPMYNGEHDGTICIRYETYEVYDMMSN